jgi:hypothetical protein
MSGSGDKLRGVGVRSALLSLSGTAGAFDAIQSKRPSVQLDPVVFTSAAIMSAKQSKSRHA